MVIFKLMLNFDVKLIISRSWGFKKKIMMKHDKIMEISNTIILNHY